MQRQLNLLKSQKEYRNISIGSNSDYYVKVCFLRTSEKRGDYQSDYIKTGTLKLTDKTFSNVRFLKAVFKDKTLKQAITGTLKIS